MHGWLIFRILWWTVSLIMAKGFVGGRRQEGVAYVKRPKFWR